MDTSFPVIVLHSNQVPLQKCIYQHCQQSWQHLWVCQTCKCIGPIPDLPNQNLWGWRPYPSFPFPPAWSQVILWMLNPDQRYLLLPGFFKPWCWPCSQPSSTWDLHLETPWHTLRLLPPSWVSRTPTAHQQDSAVHPPLFLLNPAATLCLASPYCVAENPCLFVEAENKIPLQENKLFLFISFSPIPCT